MTFCFCFQVRSAGNEIWPDPLPALDVFIPVFSAETTWLPSWPHQLSRVSPVLLEMSTSSVLDALASATVKAQWRAIGCRWPRSPLAPSFARVQLPLRRPLRPHHDFPRIRLGLAAQFEIRRDAISC